MTWPTARGLVSAGEHARRIANGRGRVQILPGIGHVPHRESETILVDTISRFLERIA
jgi:pimeloyl-ACP methyl ester carboxylesterase